MSEAQNKWYKTNLFVLYEGKNVLYIYFERVDLMNDGMHINIKKSKLGFACILAILYV